MIQIIPNWHPIFVHFTVALWTIAVVMHLIVVVYPESNIKQQMVMVARWNLWLGTAFGIVTVIAGWLASNSVAHDDISHAAMMEHKELALFTLAIFASLTGWSMWKQRKKQAPGSLFLLPLVIGAGLLMSTAWHGGELVYRYGLGVMSFPQTEAEDHEHDSHSHLEPSNYNQMAVTSASQQETVEHNHVEGEEHNIEQNEIAEPDEDGIDNDSSGDGHGHDH